MSAASLDANSRDAIVARSGDGPLRRAWIFGLLGLRAVAAFAVAAAATATAFAFGAPDPTLAAARWWIITATLVDVLCLAALVMVTRREGIRLRGLFLSRGPRDLLFIPVVAAVVAPGLAASSFLTSLTYPPAAPPEVTIVDVPAVAAVYAVVIWPVVWTITEDLMYLGFALPRLEALLGRLPAVGLVLFFWSAQHLALPFIPDGTYLLHRAITPLPIVGAMVVAYFVVGRRLLPLIVVHWLGDLFTAILATTSGSIP